MLSSKPIETRNSLFCEKPLSNMVVICKKLQLFCGNSRERLGNISEKCKK